MEDVLASRWVRRNDDNNAKQALRWRPQSHRRRERPKSPGKEIQGKKCGQQISSTAKGSITQSWIEIDGLWSTILLCNIGCHVSRDDISWKKQQKLLFAVIRWLRFANVRNVSVFSLPFLLVLRLLPAIGRIHNAYAYYKIMFTGLRSNLHTSKN